VWQTGALSLPRLNAVPRAIQVSAESGSPDGQGAPAARQAAGAARLRAIPPAVVLARAPAAQDEGAPIEAARGSLASERTRPRIPVAPVFGLRSTRQGRLSASLRDRASSTPDPLHSGLRSAATGCRTRSGRVLPGEDRAV